MTDYLSLIKKSDEIVKKYFTYVSESKDSWHSYAKEVHQAETSNNNSFIMLGDCDDLAQTTIEYAHMLGVPLNLMSRLIVDAYPYGEDGLPCGHMVGVFMEPETGARYYFGDTFGAPCKIIEREHRPKLVNNFNDGKDWIKYV